jgi:hypothetical protein
MKVRQKFRGSSRKFLGAGPMSSKMKTNFKKSEYRWNSSYPNKINECELSPLLYSTGCKCYSRLFGIDACSEF